MNKEYTDMYVQRLLNAPNLSHKIDVKKWKQELKMRGVAPKPPKIEITSGANISKLSPKIKAIFERANTNENFVAQLKYILAQGVDKLQKNAINQETFCDYFIYPESIWKKLLKLYGISEGELKQDLSKIGFFQGHRNYNDPYYQTLLIAYGIGLYVDDSTLRLLAILLISAKMWNSRIAASFKYGCDKNIARYVMNYLLQNNSVYKQYKTPLNYLVNYFITSIDKVFAPYIRQNVADPKNGLIKILTAIQPRFVQTFNNTLAKWYYYAYKKGLKEVSSDAYGQNYGEGEMVETKETIKNTIDELLDTFNKNLILNDDVLSQADAKQLLKNKFGLSNNGIEKLNQWFSDEDNQEDLKLLAEFLLHGVSPRSKEEFCSKDINSLTTEIGNAKKNEYFLRIKNYRKQLFEKIFGVKLQKSLNQTQYRWLNIISYALIIFIKKLICRKV